jgi:hypothetical protein
MYSINGSGVLPPAEVGDLNRHQRHDDRHNTEAKDMQRSE